MVYIYIYSYTNMHITNIKIQIQLLPIGKLYKCVLSCRYNELTTP